MFSVRRFSLGLPLALGLGIATLGFPVVGHLTLGTSVAHARRIRDQAGGHARSLR